MASAGDIVVTLRARVDQLERDLSKARAEIRSFADASRVASDGAAGALAKLGVGGTAALVGLSAAAAATAGTIGILKRRLEELDTFNNLSQRSGTRVQFLSSLAFNAKQANIDIGELATGLDFFNRKLVEAQDKGSKVGKLTALLGIDTAHGGERALLGLADAFAKLPDGIQKSAVAAEFLNARMGSRWIELLNSGSKGIKEQADLLRQLGGEATPQAAKAADAFNDNLTRLGAVTTGLANTALDSLLPALEKSSAQLVEIARSDAPGNLEATKQGFSGLASVIEGATNLLIAFNDERKKLGNIEAFLHPIDTLTTAVVKRAGAPSSLLDLATGGAPSLEEQRAATLAAQGALPLPSGASQFGASLLPKFDPKTLAQINKLLSDPEKRGTEKAKKDAEDLFNISEALARVEQSRLGFAEADVVRARSSVDLAEQRLRFAEQDTDLQQEQLTLATRLDASERASTQAQIAELEVRRGFAQTEGAAAAIVAQIEALNAQLALGPQHVRELERALERGAQKAVTLGSAISDSFREAVSGSTLFGDGQTFITRVASGTIGRLAQPLADAVADAVEGAFSSPRVQQAWTWQGGGGDGPLSGAGNGTTANAIQSGLIAKYFTGAGGSGSLASLGGSGFSGSSLASVSSGSGATGAAAASGVGAAAVGGGILAGISIGTSIANPGLDAALAEKERLGSNKASIRAAYGREVSEQLIGQLEQIPVVGAIVGLGKYIEKLTRLRPLTGEAQLKTAVIPILRNLGLPIGGKVNTRAFGRGGIDIPADLQGLREEAELSGNIIERVFPELPDQGLVVGRTRNVLLNQFAGLKLGAEDASGILLRLNSSLTKSLDLAVLPFAKLRAEGKRTDDQFRDIVGRLVETFGEIPKAVDAARLSFLALGADGGTNIEGLKRAVQAAGELVGDGLTAGITSAIGSGDVSDIGEALGQQLAKSTNTAYIERFLAVRKAPELTDAAAKIAQSAELLAGGDIAGGRAAAIDALKLKTLGIARAERDFAPALPILELLNGGSSSSGIVNQGGFGLPTFDTGGFVPGALGSRQIIAAQGGEFVSTHDQMGQLLSAVHQVARAVGRGQVINVNVTADIDPRQVDSAQRRNHSLQRTGVATPSSDGLRK